MNNTIGELSFQNDKPLLKMWSVNVDRSVRPFIRHSHTRFEITVIDSGSGEYTTENAVYPIFPGDVFVFSSNEIHCITKIDDGGLTITNLHFEPRYLIENSSDAYNGNFIDFCFSHSPEFQNRIPFNKTASLRQNHSMIKQELLGRGNDYATAIRSYLNLILIELIRHHNYQSHVLIGRQNNISNILAVYNYIDEHLDEPMTLRSLAAIAGLSPNYLSHLFKQLNGISLWDYIIAKRIEKAAKLILSPNSNLTMLEIALECGFNNTVNFNKAFKKQKGFTPSELKKEGEMYVETFHQLL